MSNLSKLGYSLYDGTVSIDFVGRRRIWYAISAVIVAVAAYGVFVQKLNWGIEFEGGVEYRVAMAPGQTTDAKAGEIGDVVAGTGIENASSPITNTSGNDTIRVQTEPLTTSEAAQISGLIQDVPGVEDISQDVIGPSWGQQVADRALLGLSVFLVLVVLLIWSYFREWKMSVAALVALAHDVLVTVGVYALSGFEVTPATATGVLTILGFSLYDTVVVFDKVRENVRQTPKTHKTYAEAANLAVNQTLVRSINTSIVALLPVGSLLVVGVYLLGSGALKDLALSLFVGMAAGAYSSIFIATPLLVQLKELEPGVKSGDARALRHKSRRPVDRFAEVPVYTDDMPIHSDPGAATDRGRGQPTDQRRTGATPGPPAGDAGDSGDAESGRPAPAGTPRRTTAGERPPSARPVSDSSAAHRPQPTRKPRSQRGKRP